MYNVPVHLYSVSLRNSTHVALVDHWWEQGKFYFCGVAIIFVCPLTYKARRKQMRKLVFCESLILHTILRLFIKWCQLSWSVTQRRLFPTWQDYVQSGSQRKGGLMKWTELIWHRMKYRVELLWFCNQTTRYTQGKKFLSYLRNY